MPTVLTTRSENVQKTLDYYADAASFIRIFSPNVQKYAAEHKRNAFMGKAPSLAKVRETYGKNLLESVLELHIEDLNDFCGTDKKIEGLQSQQLASMIATEYYYMKISEVALFFYYFKTGRYGKFYGAMDALTIMKQFICLLKKDGMKSHDSGRKMKPGSVRNSINNGNKMQSPAKSICGRKKSGRNPS